VVGGYKLLCVCKRDCVCKCFKCGCGRVRPYEGLSMAVVVCVCAEV
jgi:hypothetical protein